MIYYLQALVMSAPSAMAGAWAWGTNRTVR